MAYVVRTPHTLTSTRTEAGGSVRPMPLVVASDRGPVGRSSLQRGRQEMTAHSIIDRRLQTDFLLRRCRLYFCIVWGISHSLDLPAITAVRGADDVLILPAPSLSRPPTPGARICPQYLFADRSDCAFLSGWPRSRSRNEYLRRRGAFRYVYSRPKRVRGVAGG